MSVVKERKRGTMALGHRPLPPIDTRQLDHPIVMSLGEYAVTRLEEETDANCRAYLRSVQNPSCSTMERHVLASLKTIFDYEEIQDLKWCSQLPPSVQRVINGYWYGPREPATIVSGCNIGISL